jgi:hypothetical protein
VYKRFSANYSLWPELARPRRGWPLRFAVGSFMLGVACATASGFIFTSSGPAIGQGPAKQGIAERGPIYASAVTPPVTPAPAQFETENRGSRTRGPAAKTKLPIIGSQTAQPIATTDGRGSEVLAGGPPAVGSAASSSQPPSLAGAASEPAREPTAREARSEEAEPVTITEPRAEPRKNVFRKKREEPTSLVRESEPAREPRARDARSEEAKPATVTERRANPRKNIVREKREEPTNYAARDRQKREEPTRHANRRRQEREQFSPMITGAALQALRLVTGSQGWLGLQGGL